MGTKEVPFKKKTQKKQTEKHADVEEKPWESASGVQAARASNDKRDDFTWRPRSRAGRRAEHSPGEGSLFNDRRLNDQRFPRLRKRGGRGSVGPAYGAGANGHDTACAIKENEEKYITIL